MGLVAKQVIDSNQNYLAKQSFDGDLLNFNLQHAVILQLYQKGYKQKQIAEILRISHNGVKQIVHRNNYATDQLLKSLELAKRIISESPIEELQNITGKNKFIRTIVAADPAIQENLRQELTTIPATTPVSKSIEEKLTDYDKSIEDRLTNLELRTQINLEVEEEVIKSTQKTETPLGVVKLNEKTPVLQTKGNMSELMQQGDLNTEQAHNNLPEKKVVTKRKLKPKTEKFSSVAKPNMEFKHFTSKILQMNEKLSTNDKRAILKKQKREEKQSSCIKLTQFFGIKTAS